MVVYQGTRPGIVYARSFLPGGRFNGGSTALSATGVRSSSCWDERGDADEPGGVLESWVDVDGDDQERCSCADEDCGLANPLECGPEENDPQGRLEFTLRAVGVTEALLKYGDP